MEKKLTGLIIAAVALLAVSSLAAPVGKTVQLDSNTCWVVSPDEPEALRKALRDVELDWYKVIGRPPTVLREPPKKKNWKGMLIYIGVNAPWLKDLNKEKLTGRESFTLQVRDDTILAVGADMRGAIFAAYALSEEFLGVDPWYYWTDNQPAYKGKVEIPANYSRVWGPPTFKYRGFFINDEDLLAHYYPDPMEENNFSLVMWDRILETLLRVRGNTIVPGTFTFPDERCHVLADKRGLINSQHHILTVGLNTFQWPDDVPFSYSSHPEILEGYWKKCINAMKDREVVWTVGYRGKHDRAFWHDDPAFKTTTERGKVISSAIAKQVELVREVQPDADFICNLWAEGAEMYKQGYIKLPKGVIVVWPDNGTGVIRDGGQVKAGDGIYYHTAMLMRTGNQLTELVNPRRIHSEMSRFVRAGATSYFVVNISDVRQVPLTTNFAMKMAWNASTEIGKTSEQAMEDYLFNWSRRQFGDTVAKEIAAIYKDYFITDYLKERQSGDIKVFRDIWDTVINLNKEIDEAGTVSKKTVDSARSDIKICGPLHQRFQVLSKQAERLKQEIPKNRQNFYQGHIQTQLNLYCQGFAIMEMVDEAIMALNDEDKSKAIVCLDKALQEYDMFFQVLRKAEYSPWEGWYAGDYFVGIYQFEQAIRQCRAKLAGQTPPPPMLPFKHYPELYHYQKKFGSNFPLMYREN